MFLFCCDTKIQWLLSFHDGRMGYRVDGQLNVQNHNHRNPFGTNLIETFHGAGLVAESLYYGRQALYLLLVWASNAWTLGGSTWFSMFPFVKYFDYCVCVCLGNKLTFTMLITFERIFSLISFLHMILSHLILNAQKYAVHVNITPWSHAVS